MSPPNPELGFLTLPLTARSIIYEYLLTSDEQVKISTRHSTENLLTLDQQVRINSRQSTEYPLTLSILRTCKKIYDEASWTLYLKNTFRLTDPLDTLRWFDQIGPANVELLKSVRIVVPGFPGGPGEELSGVQKIFRKGPMWCEVLDRLAREAPRLRQIYVFWDWRKNRGRPFCRGKDVSFVRALAKNQGLESIVLDGYYAVHWPRYLAEKLGVPVQEKVGRTAAELLDLKEYQQGTEDLIP